MPTELPEQKKLSPGMGDSFNLVYIIMSAHALCIMPFIRSGFGTQALGVPAIVSCGVMLVYAALANAPEMGIYFVAWFVAASIQHGRSMRADRAGQFVHSRSQGWPALALHVPFVKREKTARMLIEPLMCILAGLLLCSISKPVGVFVIFGYASLIFTAGVHREVRRVRTRRLRDAQIEQEQLMRDFNRFDGYF